MNIPRRRDSSDSDKDRPEFPHASNSTDDLTDDPTDDPSDDQFASSVPTDGSSPPRAVDDARREHAESQTPAALNASAGDGLATPRDIQLALTYGLELVQHGAMLVESNGQLRIANRTANAILDKKDGIAISRTGIVADRAADTRLLYKLLEDAISSPERGEPAESPIAVQRKKARHALIVRVLPGPGLDCWPHADNRTALLKLYDQDMGLAIDERALSTLYGLTRGEAVLASRLAQGKSIEEAADELFISPHTARTHLKRIFMKTDTHRQTELVVRMLMTAL